MKGVKSEVKAGDRYNFWEVIEEVDKRKGSRRFLCKCICGYVRINELSNMRSEKTRSCGCQVREKHNLTQTKEYRAWASMKTRVLNPKTQDYARYSLLGIEPDWLTSFLTFLNDVGEAPKEGKWTLDRIDNEKGYFRGNVRWADVFQQNRNRSMSSVNTSGVTGVTLSKGSNGYYNWSAYYNDLSGNIIRKSFSVLKYENAYDLAVQWRIQNINRLEIEGSNAYGLKHGIKREKVIECQG